MKNSLLILVAFLFFSCGKTEVDFVNLKGKLNSTDIEKLNIQVNLDIEINYGQFSAYSKFH